MGKAEITTKKPVSEIQLSYPIKKHTSAFFGFIRFKALTSEVAEVKDSLSLNVKILRFLITAYIPVKPRFIRSKNVERADATSPNATTKDGQASLPAAASAKSGGAVSNEELEKTLEEILK